MSAIGREVRLPEGLVAETLVPMQARGFPTNCCRSAEWRCKRSGGRARADTARGAAKRTERIEGEWGKRCPACRYEHYPHLHPAVIVMVQDGNRCLLARKAGWAPGRYALVAGFVDNGESLEGAVAREVKEEVGLDVTDIRYVGSQNWPFPSQLMVGFVARYAGGDVTIDAEELEDARWFP